MRVEGRRISSYHRRRSLAFETGGSRIPFYVSKARGRRRGVGREAMRRAFKSLSTFKDGDKGDERERRRLERYESQQRIQIQDTRALCRQFLFSAALGRLPQYSSRNHCRREISSNVE